MKNKGVGLGAAVILLLVGGYFVYDHFSGPASGYREVPAEEPGHGVVGTVGRDEDPYDIEVAYTEDGYATTSITVKKGTRVRFLNASNGSTWPASGIHPTHTLYPEKEPTDCLGSSFDSCKRLAQGEFFDFTFNYVGRWPFHDHLHGYHSGTIVVE